jgi:hypothetical protein
VFLLVLISGAIAAWRSGLIEDLLGEESTSGTPRGSASAPAAGEEGEEGQTGGGVPSPTASPTSGAGPINTSFPGITTFRGNATRSYYGEGPVPKNPKILWRYPESGGMCRASNNLGVTKVWCGMGWTGQPNVIEHEDGSIELRFGAYDGNYHFLDGLTGERLLPDLVTGDLTKGSATSDPEGFPLYYGGSRDNRLRIIATDRKEPTVLWSIDSESSVPNPVWNDDWDAAPLIVEDYMLEGGENSWFYVIKLNRGYNAKGLVTVDPEIVAAWPGWDDQLLRDLPDEDISIENSAVFSDGIVYFGNSGGLVQGWDISQILAGNHDADPQRVFRFWVGDPTDGSLVMDEEGFLYVARHKETNVSRANPVADEIGDLTKVDPRKPKNPVVWTVHLEPEGTLSTPALYDGVVYVTRIEGGVTAVGQDTGKILWETDLPGPTWNSPVPVDDVLLVGDCSGVLHAFDISKPRRTVPELWTVQLEGCIEATPAVWKGMVYIGARGGAIYGIGDPS